MDRSFDLTRRNLLLAGSGAVAACAIGFKGQANAAIAEPSQMLALVWASGPTGFDHDFNVSAGSNMVYTNCGLRALKFGSAKLGDVYQDDFNKIELDAASKIEVNQDATKITVTLKEGILSPTGNELTSDDVAYRYERNWALRGAQWGLVKDVMLLDEHSITKESRYTYTINMKGPNAVAKIFQAHQDSGYWDTVEARKHATPDDPWATKWAASNYAGHGPWQLTQNKPGESWTLERNPNYFDKARFTGNVAKVFNKIIPSSTNRMALLQSGAVDIAFDLQASEIKRLEGVQGVRVDSFVGNYLQWLGFSFSDKADNPLNDVNVRKAIAAAIPFDEVVERPYLGLAHQMKSYVAPVYAGYDRTSNAFKLAYDLTAAQALMHQSAFASGFTVPLHYDIGQPGQEETAILIKAALAQLEISVKIVKVQTGDFYNLAFTKGKGFPGLFLYKDMAGTPDVNFGTHLWIKSGHCCAPGNYRSGKVDALYAEAAGSTDYGRRVEIQSEIERIVTQDDPMGVPLQTLGYFTASRQNVGGFKWHSLNQMTWDDAWKR